MSFTPSAVAIWNDELYIPAIYSSDIHVYNADPFAYNITITVSGMRNPYDIVASENVLYVSESENNLIHRIQLPEGSASSWTVDGEWFRLSISNDGNVVVPYIYRILEFSSFGNLVVGFVNKNLTKLHHAIRMDDDKYLVCHAGITLNRVCMIDNTGRLIKCYGESEGSGVGQLNYPRHLAIDRNGFIFVADQDNNRIVQLNSSLEYIGETVGIQQPETILRRVPRGGVHG